mmetsp:Transcript_10162/g.17424  ORF Transcript_10162/g.17424 Transcript_10162/m.17424 type:complete len:337 (-) Transcript_10162:5-1015(-)
MEDSKEDQSIDFFNAGNADDDSGWNDVDIDFGPPEPLEKAMPSLAVPPAAKAVITEQTSTVIKSVPSTNVAPVDNHASATAKGGVSIAGQPALGLPPTLSAMSNESKSGLGTSPRVPQPLAKDQPSTLPAPTTSSPANNVPTLKKETNGAFHTSSTSTMKTTQLNATDPLKSVSSSGREGNGPAGLGIASSLAAARTQTQPGTTLQQQTSTQAKSSVKPQAPSGIVQMAQASLSMTKKLQLQPNTATQQAGAVPQPQPQVAASIPASKMQPQRDKTSLEQASTQTTGGTGIIGTTQTLSGSTQAKSIAAVDGKTPPYQSGTSAQQQQQQQQQNELQ